LPNLDLNNCAIGQIEPSALKQDGRRFHMLFIAYAANIINNIE
jgi:hypothetical protein